MIRQLLTKWLSFLCIRSIPLLLLTPQCLHAVTVDAYLRGAPTRSTPFSEEVPGVTPGAFPYPWDGAAGSNSGESLFTIMSSTGRAAIASKLISGRSAFSRGCALLTGHCAVLLLKDMYWRKGLVALAFVFVGGDAIGRGHVGMLASSLKPQLSLYVDNC